MHLMYLFITSFLVVFLISSIFVFLFKKKIGIFIPLSFMIIGLTYYFIGLFFRSFIFADYLIVIYSCIGVYCLIKLFINRTTNNIFTFGLLFFFIICFCMFVYCYQYRLAYFDEFTHWGPHVRSMFSYNRLYTDLGIQACEHPEYPPFLSLLEMFFCKLYGSYSESVSAMALHIVSLSFFIVPYIESFCDKFTKSLYIFISIILSVILLDNAGFFRSIYVDIPLALIASFPMILCFSNLVDSRFGKVYYGISLGCIMLIKIAGVGFYIFNLLVYLWTKSQSKNLVKNIIIILLISLLIYLPWTFYINVFHFNLGNNSQFNAFSMLMKLLSFNIDDIQIDTIKRIFNYLLTKNALYGRLYISFFLFYLILCVVLFFFSYVYKTNKWPIVYFIVCTFVYYVFVNVVYCFSMEYAEMIELYSLSRYITAYNIFIYLFVILSCRKYINNKYFLPVATVVLFIINIPNYYQLTPKSFTTARINYEFTQDEFALLDYIQTNIDSDSNILIISGANKIMQTKISYLSEYKYHVTTSTYFTENRLDDNSLIINDLLNEMKQYDYVIFSMEYPNYFAKADSMLKQYTNCGSIYNLVVYEVINTNDEQFLYMMT